MPYLLIRRTNQEVALRAVSTKGNRMKVFLDFFFLPYLNYIHLLSATVPDLKLLHISFDILCDSHSSHLSGDTHTHR